MGNHVHGQSVPTEANSQIKIQVKPMLTTAQKNFKEVPHPTSILSGSDGPEVTRADLTVPGAQCFLLHGLLSESECSHYITETEKIGYSGLADLFPSDYRSNDRVLSICEPLVDELWRRIEPSLTRKEVIRVRPMGFGNEGTWKPFRLNECCKFGKYKLDGHFSPHIDGPWVPREDESSVFTVVIYLNSDFEGGATRFLSEDDPNKAVCSVSPKTGSALIFNHDTLHEGEPVTMGTKYIIRTEIMYRRVDTEMLPDPGAYQNEENYIKTLTLYQKSWELEQEGDVKGFTDTYLQAIQLQRQAQRSISTDSSACDFIAALPYEVYLKIFGFLTAKELCRIMTVNKSWYDVCMDGQLWYDLYRRKWPVGIKLEAETDVENPTLKFTDERPFLRDWYGHYKQRSQMKQPQKVAVIDLGSFSFKCAALHRAKSTIRKSSIESVVATVPGAFDLHMRRFSYQRYFCGREAKEGYPGQTEDIVVGGLVRNPYLLPEVVTGLFLDCRVRPKYTPVVLLEPPGLWSDEMKESIAVWFLYRFLNPSICFLSSAVATLCSVDLPSGVVVDVGHGVATCAAVVNRELRGSESCTPGEATPGKLASMADRVIKGSATDEKEMSMLKANVVLTGGMACRCDLLQQELANVGNQVTVQLISDPVYSAVLGGCIVANLSQFQKVEESDLKHYNKDSLPGEYLKRDRSVQASWFYSSSILYWYKFLNGSMQNTMRMLLYSEDPEWVKEWKEDVIEEELYQSDTEPNRY